MGRVQPLGVEGQEHCRHDMRCPVHITYFDAVPSLVLTSRENRVGSPAKVVNR